MSARLGEMVHYRFGDRCHAAVVVDTYKTAPLAPSQLNLRVFFGAAVSNSPGRENYRPTFVKFGKAQGEWHRNDQCEE